MLRFVLLGGNVKHRGGGENLEMKDAGVVLREALVRGDHSVQQLLVDGQAGDGGQQPAVPCRQQIHEL